QAVTLHTDLGDIKIELFCERTLKACEANYYTVARLGLRGAAQTKAALETNAKPSNMKARELEKSPRAHICGIGFKVKSGGSTGTGKGGSSIWGRKFEDEFSEHLKHSVRGVVSMANNGPNTNGSQFFLTYGKQPHLDMKYTVFGKVIDGLETLDELEKLPVNEKTFRPLTEVRIKDITIHANPFA
uniref:Peptidyl-prolyl cis-trans isomerase n=1 Tax=Latimeria chalumnae TaxID=7897 RepID=H3B673_LATCH